MKTTTLIIILVVAALVVLGLTFIPGQRTDIDVGDQTREEETIACTLDALMCPDGSYVGRVPPTCQFAACPDGSVPEDGSPSSGATIELDTDASFNPDYFGEGK